MNERDLRYLVVIAETDSLRLASDRLLVTQPALTKCIERLEQELGAKLFHREGRALDLTPEGTLMVQRARDILRNMEEARQELRDRTSGIVGHLRIGAAATFMDRIMPDVLERMSSEHPGITLELSIGMNDVLRSAMDSNALDMVLGPTSGSEAYDVQNLIDDTVVVVASADNELSGGHAMLEDLNRYSWVLPNRSVALRDWLEKRFAELGLPPPRVRIEVNSLALMPPLIARTSLLTFMSTKMAGGDIREKGLKQISLPDLELQRTFGLLTRRNSYIPSAGRLFMATVRDVIRQRPARG